MEIEDKLAELQSEIASLLAGDYDDEQRDRYAPVLSAMVQRDAPEVLEHTFRKPVKHGDRTYTSISCRAPSWGEMKAALKNGNIEASTWLAHMLGATPIQVLNKLDARDGSAIDRFFARFS